MSSTRALQNSLSLSEKPSEIIHIVSTKEDVDKPDVIPEHHQAQPTTSGSLADTTQYFEKNINLIWLGSTMLPAHLIRVLEWRKLNPTYTVFVWTHSDFEADIIKQFEARVGIHICNIDSLPISKKLNNFIKKLIIAREDGLLPNYAAASDCIRFHIDGWYVDTDVIPRVLSSVLINPELKFYFQSANTYGCFQLSPGVIGTARNSLLQLYAIDFLTELSRYNLPIGMIRSNSAAVRLLATEISTGGALEAALKRIDFQNRKVIDAITRDVREELITAEFNVKRERLWLLDAFKKPLKGLVFDRDYYSMSASISYNHPTMRFVSELQSIVSDIQETFEKDSFQNKKSSAVAFFKPALFIDLKKIAEIRKASPTISPK